MHGFDESRHPRDRIGRFSLVAAGAAAIAKLHPDTGSDRFEPIDTDGWKRTSEPMGSNPGGWNRAPDGTDWYIKQSRSGLHARNEVLAAELYTLAGTPVADVHLARVDGKLGTASRTIPGASPDLPGSVYGGDEKYLDRVREGFAAHAWLANWDSVGLVHDNIVSDRDGTPTLIDTGGSLLFRARGGPKGPEFDTKVGEWDTLRDPDRNPEASAVFEDITDQQLAESARKVAAVTPNQIRRTVSRSGIEGETDIDVAAILLARRARIIELAGLNKSQKTVLNHSPFVTPVLTQPENVILDDYTNPSYYTLINGFLRHPNKIPVEWDTGDDLRVASDAQILQDAINRHPTAADTKVYRGLNLDLTEVEVGTQINDRGFMSTSINQDIAKGFGNFLLEIEVPKGTGALHLGGPENEVLLPSNSTLEVTNIDRGMVESKLVK